MKLTGVEKVENCIAGDFVYRYFFDGPWKKKGIQIMAGTGNIKYYADFPRPLYEVRFSDGTILKGVESEREFRVIFKRGSGDLEREAFQKRCGEIAGTI
ncbi:hypothetical protein AGMMS49546_18120 [Spirochaetia bacterium]|nr:hypothetical protein AGMMS49546_18120 [Spirochaetia bacterium]